MLRTFDLFDEMFRDPFFSRSYDNNVAQVMKTDVKRGRKHLHVRHRASGIRQGRYPGRVEGRLPDHLRKQDRQQRREG